ncbi:AAA family ATPase [Belnapia sp. T18]|uniref:AAA family ATPase n=1 Tax=Belnapia arida TaxID=2804533 RepID=A0ABS1U6C5_9PROT|nr:AAA family ATPase [Belnapia arida]MBL6080213.1 AAA family ATPase [Belnapia arida]
MQDAASLMVAKATQATRLGPRPSSAALPRAVRLRQNQPEVGWAWRTSLGRQIESACRRYGIPNESRSRRLGLSSRSSRCCYRGMDVRHRVPESDQPQPRQLQPSRLLTGRDLLLLRQSRRQKRYAELSDEERDVYSRIDLLLRDMARTVQAALGSDAAFPAKLTSGFNPQSGVRGALPKDLWFGVHNAANLPDFVGMPQLFTIVSERGVEYGFAPAIHPSDFSQQGIKDKVRAAAPEIFARLPAPGSAPAARLAAELRRSGGWRFRQKTRLEPGPGEFENFDEWLAFLRSDRGRHWAGGAISRYVTADELGQVGSDFTTQLCEAVELFGPLLHDLTPGSEPGELPPTPPFLDDSVPPVNSDAAPAQAVEARPPYPMERAVEGLFLPEEEFARWLAVWRGKRNLVLQGAPGVGKSFIARRLAYALIGYEDPGRAAMVQFHQSYAYENFVQGFRPREGGGFELQDGAFVAFCRRALADPDESYVFIIDEINRGNLSKILGEMMLLIEPDKRDRSWATRLAYASPDRQAAGDPMHQPFHVPKNVFLIGMMNTADRSLAVVDYALRRRFAFVTAQPAYDRPAFAAHLAGKGVPVALVAQICGRMAALNREIAADRANLGPGFCIGHSFFVPRDDAEVTGEGWYEAVIATEVLPLLEEYSFDDPDKVEQWRRMLLAPEP